MRCFICRGAVNFKKGGGRAWKYQERGALPQNEIHYCRKCMDGLSDAEIDRAIDELEKSELGLLAA